MIKQKIHILSVTFFSVFLVGMVSCTSLQKNRNSSLAYNETPMILKSPADTRNYDSFVLKNGLQVLLISDASADEAAAALDIRTGQFQDPQEHQGLAHFLEHMLFLGTKKFPEAGEFGKFLSSHGGSSNAYTSHENTNYHFSVQVDSLEESLDRFSQFFIAPTFDPAFVEREVNAVNSEHQKNIKNDWRRMYQVLREVSNPKHPFSRFGTGNLKTLWEGIDGKEDLRKLLITFYERYYSSNLMKVTILGKEDLPQLKVWAKKYFSPIPDKNITAGNFKEIPVLDASLPRKILIQPIKATRTLRLMFPTPSQREFYLSKPGQVISHILGDESKGSILSLLKQKTWAVGLSSGAAFGSKDFSFFDISISLTKEGLNHIDEITGIVFQAIDLIEKDQNLERYFIEMKKIAKIEFQFLEKSNPIRYVTSLASQMHDVPVEHVLASRLMYKKFDQQQVDNLLSYIKPSNLQMVLVKPEVKTSKKERWYETPYEIEQIEQSRVTLWAENSDNKGLVLPEPNPFIPENVTLVSVAEPKKYPHLIMDKPGFRVWFKQEDQFKVPKGNLRIILSTPVAYSNVKNAALAKLYTMLVRDALNELTYPASLAGLHYSLSNSVRGLEISVAGYSENIQVLFGKILDVAMHLEISPDKFKVFQNQILEERQNQKLGQAYHRSMYEMGYVTSEKIWHTDDYLAVIEGLTKEGLNEFIPSLLSNLNVEAFAHGNFTRREIDQITDLLLLKLDKDLTKPATKVIERTLNLPEGDPTVFQLKVADVNSAINMYYQAGPVNLKQSVSLDLIKTIMGKPFYHQLRTIEQLGYLVWSGYRKLNKVEGLYFLIQSGVKEPVYLQSRIENFLSEFEQTLTKLTQQEFAQFKATLIKKRQEPPQRLSEATSRFWGEISSQNYDFSQREKEIEILEEIKLSEVISLFRKLVLTEESVKKITIQAVGNKHDIKTPREKLLVDLKQFKQEMNYYQNPEGEISSTLREKNNSLKIDPIN